MLLSTPSGGLTVRLPESQEQQDAEELMAWLALQGLTPRQATQLISTSGVHSLHGLALFFRFELPPLWLANTESVRDHMRTLCGVGGQRALRMLSELGVAGVIAIKLADIALHCSLICGLVCTAAHESSAGAAMAVSCRLCEANHSFATTIKAAASFKTFAVMCRYHRGQHR